MCRNVQITLGINLRPSLVKVPTHLNFGTAPQAKNGNHFFLLTSQKIDTFIDFFLINLSPSLLYLLHLSSTPFFSTTLLHHHQLPEFFKPAVQLAYGENASVLSEDRVAVTQALSGTGALRILAAFIAKFYPGPKTVWMPNPTWGNHIPIMGHR